MLAELVILTRFLGLVSGEQEVRLRPSVDVQRVEIRHDGATVATLAGPPWQTKIDLGEELAPSELIAVGFDAKGGEVARDTQILNLARPPADAGVVLEKGADGTLSARPSWTRLDGVQPTAAVVKLDGKIVGRSVTDAAALGPIDENAAHIISVELQFSDGVVARKEMIFGGGYPEAAPPELTSIAVRQRGAVVESNAACLQVGGRKIEARAAEAGQASVSFVINGGADVSFSQKLPKEGEDPFPIPDSEVRVIVPVLRAGPNGHVQFGAGVMPGSQGTRAVLRSHRPTLGRERYADAIAATGLRALRGEHRRAIVLVIGPQPTGDTSVYSPAIVRRYLERIGVPLRVWSLIPPRPELAEWGPTVDISTPAALQKATEELRHELDSQRMARIPAGPLDALRTVADANCGLEPLAKP
jgi:hypothetical protein